MCNCKYCGKEFEKSKIACHTKWCNLNPNRGKGVFKEPRKKFRICQICGASFEYDKMHRRKTCNDPICRKKIKLHSNATKKLLSEKRKQWLKDHPAQHPWKKSTKFISKPCEKLKAILKDNDIEFFEEFSPIEDRFFSIDIFIPSKSIGLEVNGNQHYDRNGELKKYYQERHNTIKQHGIKLIEIHYIMVYRQNFIDDLIAFIKEQKEIDISNYKVQIKETKRQKIEKQKKEKSKKNDNLIEYRKNIIINSNIDFTKQGWNKKVSDMLCISHTHVRRFMKKHMPDLYSKCFIRKSCNSN